MDGIVGVYGVKDPELVNKTFLATAACQHRGKACTGLAIGTRKGIYIHKGLGRIADVVDENLIRVFQDLEPTAAIGNIGYTKRKVAEKINAEPIEIRPRKRSKYTLALTMDGYLVKEDDLKTQLEEEYSFETDNKTEVVGALLHKF
jgi:amidophosphoribosyltransferase